MTSPRQEWILSRLRSDGAVLDVGYVGGGDAGLHRAIRDAAGAAAVFGVDIRVARSLMLPLTLCAWAERLPFKSETFHQVILAEILEHVFDPRSLVAEAARVLLPGGQLLITTPNPLHPMRWLRSWLLSRQTGSSSAIRRYMGSEDHVTLLPPLSLVSLIRSVGCELVELSTRNIHLPLAGRLIGRELLAPEFLNLGGKLGGYVCVRATKGS